MQNVITGSNKTESPVVPRQQLGISARTFWRRGDFAEAVAPNIPDITSPDFFLQVKTNVKDAVSNMATYALVYILEFTSTGRKKHIKYCDRE
jgi:hypothetical protein